MSMLTPIVVFIAVAIFVSLSTVEAMCISTETSIVDARVLKCEDPALYLNGAAKTIHELQGKVAYPDRDDFVAMVVERNREAVVLTLEVREERMMTWRWGRGAKMRKVKEFRGTAVPRVEQLWRWLEPQQSCADFPLGASVQFVIDPACEDVNPYTLGPSVTGHRIAIDAKHWTGDAFRAKE